MYFCSQLPVKDAVLTTAVGVGIWDTKFGVYHSWVPLADTKHWHGQVDRHLVTEMCVIYRSLFGFTASGPHVWNDLLMS